MSTPTPSKKTMMSNNVSTPMAHSLSSPVPPRSVPSPVTTRKDQSSKTPVGHGTTGSSQGSKTVGGTPMMLNLSQQGSMASPMLGGLSGMTPTGLGVDLGTPGNLNISTPALGIGMMPTMSELGLTVSGGLKRNEDEERRAKMRKILKAIGKPKGRVSEEGIARASRRVGFANDIDVEKLTAEERERRVGNRTISIAGNTIVIDVDLKNHIPKNVQVLFSNDMSSAGGNADRAAMILLDDLSPPRVSQIHKTLDRFTSNLERLARLDRLSSTKVNCFDALSGVYASLRRLYDQESKLAADLHKDDQYKVRAEIMVKRSGVPALHADRALGLSITYWSELPVVVPDIDAMQIDGSIEVENRPGHTHKIWLEAERCPSGLYPSIRTTDTWLPGSLDIHSFDDAIPWQDPPTTHLAPGVNGAGLADESTQLLPDVRFVAKFDPPLVLPWQVAANIFTAIGSTIPAAFQVPTYMTLLLDLSTNLVPSNILRTQVEVLRPFGDDFDTIKHMYNINVAKYDLGYRLEELPFSHPRQIVELLPVLRQWSCIKSMLLDNLNARAADIVNVNAEHVRLDDLLNAEQGSFVGLSIECGLILAPMPTLSITFPLLDGSLFNEEIQISTNGELRLIDHDGTSSKAAKALQLCNDVGVWIEWLRACSES